MRRLLSPLVAMAGIAAVWGIAGCEGSSPNIELLNASYDPTRELYRKLNRAFAEQYEHETGTKIRVRQSHGGSGSQARTVIDGLPADVVALALWSDTNAIAKKGLIEKGWESRLPNRSLPYYSTIVFVVRKGNPKGIHDWPDLLKPGVQIISPNPKTSGGARLNVLAAWGAVLKKNGINEKSTPQERTRAEEEAKEFITQLFQQCPVLDSGARGSTVTFARRMIGDVHLTWENEAHLEFDEMPNDLEVIYPSTSIMAEPHVAVVDRNVDDKKTRRIAEEYVNFLYSDRAQEIIARSHYRPWNQQVAAKHADRLRDIDLFRIDYVDEGGWEGAQKRFFADGGLFDQIYQPSSK